MRWTRVAAYGLFVEDGRILLCRVSAGNLHAGKWTLPGGGVEFGESPQDAAWREIMEETGLEADLSATAHVDSRLVDLTDGSTLHSMRLVFRATPTGGRLRDETDGSTDACRWMTPDEARASGLVDLAQFGLELAFPVG